MFPSHRAAVGGAGPGLERGTSREDCGPARHPREWGWGWRCGGSAQLQGSWCPHPSPFTAPGLAPPLPTRSPAPPQLPLSLSLALAVRPLRLSASTPSPSTCPSTFSPHPFPPGLSLSPAAPPLASPLGLPEPPSPPSLPLWSPRFSASSASVFSSSLVPFPRP